MAFFRGFHSIRAPWVCIDRGGRLLIRWKRRVALQTHKPHITHYGWPRWMIKPVRCPAQRMIKLIYCTVTWVAADRPLTAQVSNLASVGSSRAGGARILHKKLCLLSVDVCHKCNRKPLNDEGGRQLWQEQMLPGLNLTRQPMFVCVETLGVTG